jgi:fumarate hydratase class II
MTDRKAPKSLGNSPHEIADGIRAPGDSTTGFRTEHDSMGELQVPSSALWGAQTQRAVQNFVFSGLTLPGQFISALGLVKWAAADANEHLNLLPTDIAAAIKHAALAVADGKHAEHFPVDVFQTGSGTSSNMNANEVIAHLASSELGKPVHENDHVNMCQSSNDVIPTCIHVSAALALRDQLIPALMQLEKSISTKALEYQGVVTTGRTHLMDAMPITLAQELSGWAKQVKLGIDRLIAVQPRLHALALGGTAVGTGINAHPDFARRAVAKLTEKTGLPFTVSDNYFESLSAQDAAVELSGQLKTNAVSLVKIANDLRLMNSGPLAGLSEIALPSLQPGSSIMPGKINPVIPEAVAMIGAQVIGNDMTITIAGQSGNFQLNVMLPVIAYNLLQSMQLLANAARALGTLAIAGFVVNADRIAESTALNPILVTALNPIVGYERAATIAKRAYAERRPILDVAIEMTGMDKGELQRLLNAHELTKGGIKSGNVGGG